MMAPPTSTVASAFASPGTGPVLDIASHLASLVEADIESLATGANTVDHEYQSDADFNSNTTSGTAVVTIHPIPSCTSSRKMTPTTRSDARLLSDEPSVATYRRAVWKSSAPFIG
ncbi:MAG: ERAD-associated protein [Watsoniomyces obsoletus]|nr:MAG: ERAD-associated protein [Watsoniomyces obsoletus]